MSFLTLNKEKNKRVLGSIMGKKTRLFILSLLLTNTAMAQNGSGDFFTNIGKIYVVVAVLLIMFAILVGFLIFLERKISKLEKQITDESN